MCGSLILLIFFVKYILHCFVANLLSLQFMHCFFGGGDVGPKHACVNEYSFSMSSLVPLERMGDGV